MVASTPPCSLTIDTLTPVLESIAGYRKQLASARDAVAAAQLLSGLGKELATSDSAIAPRDESDGLRRITAELRASIGHLAESLNVASEAVAAQDKQAAVINIRRIHTSATLMRNWSVNNAIEWIKDTGIDGFRLDAVKHIEQSWLYDLRTRVREEVEAASGERFYMVGETFSADAALISSYVDPLTQLDGQFDFPLRAALSRSLLRREGSMVERRLTALLLVLRASIAAGTSSSERRYLRVLTPTTINCR